MSQSDSTSQKSLHVVIIGAGISGLEFARILSDAPWCKLTILEGRPNLGGTWAPGESYHNLETHAPRCSFAKLFSGQDKKFERVSQGGVYDGLTGFCEKYGLSDKIKYNCSVERLEHLEESAVVHLAGGESISADFVIYTGSTFTAYTPSFPKASEFQGVISACKDVRTEQFEEILNKNKRVVVLGGSKAAQDMVYNFCERGYYNFTWVFRRTYWGINYDFMCYKYGLICHFMCRLTPWLRKVMFKTILNNDIGKKGFWSWLYMRILVGSGYLLNPKRTSYQLGHFHGAIFAPERNEALSNLGPANYERAEIASMLPDGVLLTNNKKVEADVVICATGQSNTKVPVDDSTGVPFEGHKHEPNTFFRGMFRPSNPRIMYMNTIALGNIMNDADKVGNWLSKCYLPQMMKNGTALMQQLLERGLKNQISVLQSVGCRSFDLWHAFDRPIPYQVYVGHSLAEETQSGNIEINATTDGNYWLGKAYDQLDAGNFQ